MNCADGFDIEIIISGEDDTAQWTPSEWRLNNVNQSSCEPTFDESAETLTYNFDGKTCNGSFTNTLGVYLLVEGREFHVEGRVQCRGSRVH